MPVIYKIQNTINGDCYVGVANVFEKRIRRHFNDLKNSSHHNPYLQNVYSKYGNIFDCIVLEYFELLSDAFSKEPFYIKLIGTYNISKGGIGGNNLSKHPNKENIYKKKSIALKGRDVGFGKGYKHSDSYKKHMSLIMSGENNPNYNKKFSENQKLLMSLGQKKRFESEEERKKCNAFANLTEEETIARKKVWSECKKGPRNNKFKHDKPVNQIDPITEEIINTYPYARILDEYGFTARYVIDCCNKKKGYHKHKGYKWEFSCEG